MPKVSSISRREGRNCKSFEAGLRFTQHHPAAFHWLKCITGAARSRAGERGPTHISMEGENEEFAAIFNPKQGKGVCV